GDERVIARAKQLHFVFDSQVVDAIFEASSERAIANDVDGEIAAALGEDSGGFDEDVEAFDLDKTADGGEAEGRIGVVIARLEKVDVDAVGLDVNFLWIEVGGEC